VRGAAEGAKGEGGDGEGGGGGGGEESAGSEEGHGEWGGCGFLRKWVEDCCERLMVEDPRMKPPDAVSVLFERSRQGPRGLLKVLAFQVVEMWTTMEMVPSR